tara:strand:+ start:362 stop:1381 length:1020 start_codon:yes stop_codon:yes gene_type:complete
MIPSSLRSLAAKFEGQLLTDKTIISLQTYTVDSGSEIYKAELSSGETLAIKVYKRDSYNLALESMNCEVQAISYLNKMGCAVPEYIAADQSMISMATSWCGDHNLRQLISDNAAGQIEPTELIRSLMSVEVTYMSTPNMSSVSSQIDTRNEQLIRSRLRQRDLSYLPTYLKGAKRLNPTANTLELEMAIRKVLRTAKMGVWTYGSMDCNASNIVVRNGHATLIDFSMLGPDWIEKRICSYTMSPSIVKNEQLFFGALNGLSYKMYDEIMSQWIKDYPSKSQLDVHFTLGLLSAASKLPAQNPDCPKSIGLQESTLQSIHELLLSPQSISPADAIRAAIG